MMILGNNITYCDDFFMRAFSFRLLWCLVVELLSAAPSIITNRRNTPTPRAIAHFSADSIPLTTTPYNVDQSPLAASRNFCFRECHTSLILNLRALLDVMPRACSYATTRRHMILLKFLTDAPSIITALQSKLSYLVTLQMP